jgi:hypothetical protein
MKYIRFFSIKKVISKGLLSCFIGFVFLSMSTVKWWPVVMMITLMVVLTAIKVRDKSIVDVLFISLQCYFLMGSLRIMEGIALFDLGKNIYVTGIFSFCINVLTLIDCLVLMLLKRKISIKAVFVSSQIIFLMTPFFLLTMFEGDGINFVIFCAIVLGAIYALVIGRFSSFRQKCIAMFIADIMSPFVFIVLFGFYRGLHWGVWK